MTDYEFNGFLYLIRHTISSIVNLIDGIPIVGDFSVWDFLIVLGIVSILTFSIMRLAKR